MTNYCDWILKYGRCLLKCPNIDLWKCYLNYIESAKKKLPNGREQVTQVLKDEIFIKYYEAYEFALEHISMDISCTQIWIDYINFLKELKVH